MKQPKKKTTGRNAPIAVPQTKHLIVKWNPSESFEPDTIAVHAEILARFPTTRPYVWWGKISKTGKVGIDHAEVVAIQRQIKAGRETHLYLYCPDKDKPTLHAALVEWIQVASPGEADRTPRYYTKIAYPIPFWIKVRDIRELTIEHLQYLSTAAGQPYDPVASNLYPLVVLETRETKLFDYSHPGSTKWCLLQQLDQPNQGQPTLDPHSVFVLMPFADEFTDVWRLGIKPSVETLGLSCSRADDFLHTRNIMDVIRESIRRARLVIADMTTNNPNVFYELGYAHALSKPVILITRDRVSVPFDLRGVNNLEYKHASDLVDALPAFIKAVLQL
jgi:hypothetical protein